MAIILSKPSYPVVHPAPSLWLATWNIRFVDWFKVAAVTAISYPIGYHLIGMCERSACWWVGYWHGTMANQLIGWVIGNVAKPPVPRHLGGWSAVFIAGLGYVVVA
jgi:hypothetical protein